MRSEVRESVVIFMKTPLMRSPVFLLFGMILWTTIATTGLHAQRPADTARFNALMKKAFPFFQTNLDSAGFYYKTARALAVANHDRGEYADAGNELGNYYRDKGDVTDALPYYQEARGIFDSLRDWVGEGLCDMNTAQLYKNIAGINKTQTLLDQGIQFAIRSYELFLRAHDTAHMMNALNEEGIIYRDKDRKSVV